MDLKDVGNGCGPRWLPGWLVPDFCWRGVCDLHDLAYYLGGTAFDRRRADYAFLDAMLEVCPWYLAPVAYLYFGYVRCFGWLTFNFGGRTT